MRSMRHEHLCGDRRVPLGVAHVGECLGHRRLGREHDQLRRHQRAGGALWPRQQLAHRVGIVFVHRLEHLRALFAAHLSEQVGEVVEFHLVEHAVQAVEVEALDEFQLLVFGQLLEHVGEPLVVHCCCNRATLFDRKCCDERRDVARVHVAQSRRLGGNRRYGCEEIGNLAPVDHSERRTHQQSAAFGKPHLGDAPHRVVSAVML